MQVFNLGAMGSHPYGEREKNVFYQKPRFKARIIELPAGGTMPVCEMASHVLFYVIRGQVEVKVDGEVASLREEQCLVTDPATVSMTTANGVKMLGIQVAAN